MTSTLTLDITRRAGATSYLDRLISLGGSVDEEYTGTEVSYRLLLRRLTPADAIDHCDTTAQVLFLLELDTDRRDQLRALAADHDWPEPAVQPWEPYIRQHCRG